MPKRNLIRYLAALAAILLLRAFDLLFTFVYTPHLAAEWNPVVSHLKASWTGMVLVQLAVIAVIAVPMYYYFFSGRVVIAEPGLRYNEFVYFFFFGRKPVKGVRSLLVFPRNPRGILIYNGFALMWAVIGISIFAILHNLLLIFHVRRYEEFVFDHHTPYFLSVYLLVAAAATYVYFIREYLRYKKLG